MSIYLWIGLGGFLGANARYVLTVWVADKWGVTFPYGTLVINLSGSFLLCLLIEVFSTYLLLRTPLHLALTVGFLGAYTTFSTFSYEWLRLLQAGEVWPCLIYIFGSALGGGVAGVAGFSLGRLL